MQVRVAASGIVFTLALAVGSADAQRHGGDSDHGRRVEADAIELGHHERHDGTALRVHDRKVGWLRADFTDAEGRRGAVDISVKNDSECRLELRLFIRSKGEGHHDRDRESTTIRVRRNDRESTRVRFDLPRSERPRVIVDAEGRLEDCR
jgi:hypothetical protein